MDSTVFLSLSLSRWKNREKKKRKRRRRRRRTLRGFERGSPTNYLLRYDLPRLCSCLSPAEWAFKLPREIKLLRVSSRYYTHAPPIDSPPLPALLYPFWIRCAYNIKKPLWFRTINKIRGWTPPPAYPLPAFDIPLFNRATELGICLVFWSNGAGRIIDVST